MNRIKSALIAAGAVAMLASPAMVDAGTPWDKIVKDKSRFMLLKDFNELAVRDNETGLVWERYPDLTARSWFIAISSCEELVVSGRMGWRLPSLAELTSLLDFTQNEPLLPLGHPFQLPQDGNQSGFWSANTVAGSTGNARYVNVFWGDLTATSKVTVSNRAWCVRGGSGFDGQ